MKNAKIKKTIVIKMEFDLVDWVDNSTVPEYFDVVSTLKIVSIFNENPNAFTKAQTKIINTWLKRNSIDKFLRAKLDAEKHLAKLREDALYASSLRTKLFLTNH